MFRIKCAVCSIECVFCYIKCAVRSIKYALCNIKCAVCNIECALCNVKCALRDIECAGLEREKCELQCRDTLGGMDMIQQVLLLSAVQCSAVQVLQCNAIL